MDAINKLLSLLHSNIVEKGAPPPDPCLQSAGLQPKNLLQKKRIHPHSSRDSGEEVDHSNPMEDIGSNPSSEKKQRFLSEVSFHLIKQHALGLFGSDIPQILHITEKDYNCLKGPVLTHLNKT